MTTERDMAIAIATEIGKQVPVKQVYDDAVSPAARQIGFAFEDVVKCIRLVGFPIQAGAILQDRLRAMMERVAQQVPEDRRVLPAPQILGPILEGIRYEIDDTPIADMFANLLGAAMDTERLGGIFPHFPSLVRVLSPDQAKILKHLTRGNITAIHQIVGIIFELNNGLGNVYLIEDLGVDFPENSNLYFDHLFSLGLIGWKTDSRGVATFQGKEASEMLIQLSPMGAQFMKVCLPPTPAPGTP